MPSLKIKCDPIGILLDFPSKFHFVPPVTGATPQTAIDLGCDSSAVEKPANDLNVILLNSAIG
jgi:hypothetical protein